MDQKPILLVEDDPNDIYLLKYAFKQVGLTNPLQVVDNGQLAIDYLAGAGQFCDRETYPLPCLVLLDLKLPQKHGLEVLAWIRSQPVLRLLVVIVFTASAQEGDVEHAYQLGVNSFIVKPSDVHRRRQIVEHLKNWWLDLNEYPHTCEEHIHR